MDEKGKSPKKYSYEYKLSTIQLAEKIGVREAALKLGIDIHLIYDWRKAAREGRLRATAGYPAQGSVVSIMEEVDVLRKSVKTLEREKYILSSEIEHLRSVNDFLSASLREEGKESPAS